MSNIVAFKEFESQRKIRQAPCIVHGSAEIILFTGVRYERTEAPAGPASPDTFEPSKHAVAVKKRRRRL